MNRQCKEKWLKWLCSVTCYAVVFFKTQLDNELWLHCFEHRHVSSNKQYCSWWRLLDNCNGSEQCNSSCAVKELLNICFALVCICSINELCPLLLSGEISRVEVQFELFLGSTQKSLTVKSFWHCKVFVASLILNTVNECQKCH